MAYALTPEFRSGCLTDKGIMRTYTWNSGTSQSGGCRRTRAGRKRRRDGPLLA